MPNLLAIKKNASGEIEQIKDRTLFPRSEYHARFPSLFAMNDSLRWGTYFRSMNKKLEGVNKNEVTFMGNQVTEEKGMKQKTGNFFSPYRYEEYKNALKPCSKSTYQVEPAYYYDALLEQQKAMAAFIVEKVKEKRRTLKINSDNQYTCVLFSCSKPDKEKNPKIWTQFLILYFVAIMDKLAYERGINIEMVHRSSFGSIRPSVSECGKSIRINLGLIPKEYAECIVDGILYLEKLVRDEKLFKIELKPGHLSDIITTYNQENLIPEGKKIQLKKTVWDTLWASGDKSGRSFATQLFRRTKVVECLIDWIVDGCMEKNLDDLFKDKTACKKAFVKPLEKALKLLVVKKSLMTIDLGVIQPKKYTWKEANIIKDEQFWTLSRNYLNSLRVNKNQLERFIKSQKTEDFHSQIEAWILNFIYQPLNYKSVKDGWGSDSDTEGELGTHKKSITIYATKIITATGMRAIQLAYVGMLYFLEKELHENPLRFKLLANRSYYETIEALLKHPIPFQSAYEESKKSRNIVFFDINHCNSEHEAQDDPMVLVDKNDIICTIDVTSAKTTEINAYLTRLFSNSDKLQVILAVSSGLKNEQGMADYNPYGTVRIFTKNPATREYLYHVITNQEKKAGYEHAKLSHMMRKTCKQAGFTPTNNAILYGANPRIPFI